MRVICEHTGGFIGRRSCSEPGRSAGFCTQAVEKNLWPRELPETPRRHSTRAPTFHAV